MPLEQSSKDIIDSLTFDELEQESHKGRFSRFQNENFTYLTMRLNKLVRDAQLADIAKTHQLAEEANLIAKESKNTAALSYRIAVLAVIISLVAIIVTQCSKF